MAVNNGVDAEDDGEGAYNDTSHRSHKEGLDAEVFVPETMCQQARHATTLCCQACPHPGT